MNGWMGRVRLIIGEGTCEHYGSVTYLKKDCPRCWMIFLACPICKPRYCPSCKVDMQENRDKQKPVIETKLKGMRWVRSKKGKTCKLGMGH